MSSKSRFTDSTQAAIIQNRRDQILEDIHLAGIKFHRGEDEKDLLKDEYNRLSHQLERLRCGPFKEDPLVTLPPEVWTEIIRETTNENGTNLSSTDSLLSFTLVNTRWNTKILNTPRLWTDITIGNGEADAQAKLGAALCLSKPLHVKLRIHILPWQWDQDLPLLQLHANRIKEIAFLDSKGGAFYGRTCTEFVDRLFASLGYLPSLRIIRNVTSAMVDWQDIFTRSPALTHLYWSTVPIPVLQSHDGPPFRACAIGAPSINNMRHLNSLRHLEHLTWVAINEPSGYHSDAAPPSLPALKGIISYHAPTASLHNVLTLASLTSLEASIFSEWQCLYDLFNLFEHLPCLLILILKTVNVPGKLVFPVMRPKKTSVQDLLVEDWGFENENTEGNQEALFTLFPVYFSEVRVFDVTASIVVPSLATYIRSVPHLWHLQLRVWGGLSAYGILIESPTLEVLHLDGVVATIKCRSLMKLGLGRVPFGQEASQRRHNIDSSIYSNIETLEVRTLEYQWEIPRFNALRKLGVGSANSNSGAHEFFVCFILQPQSCPVLEEIELAYIPEWDLLFMMLEHRNYLPPSHGITRIKTLTLPSPIPPILIAPLVKILGGQFTVRPSNRALSFCGFMEAYFDPSILGCGSCLRSMMFCSASLHMGHLGIDQTFDNQDSHYFETLDLPSYTRTVPARVWEWLYKREDRLLEWEQCQEKARVEGGGYLTDRVKVCITMKRAQRPFTITGRSSTNLGNKVSEDMA